MEHQGKNAHAVFAGEGKSLATKQFYGESAPFFAVVIKHSLGPGQYRLVDVGSHSGGLLRHVLDNLPEYTFDTIAIDINGEVLRANPAHRKICADLAHIPMEEQSVDVVMARHVLSWNSLEKQKTILEEIARITKRVAIIQHYGPDVLFPDKMRAAMNRILHGEVVPALKKKGFYISTSSEVEQMMHEAGISFKKVQDRKIDNLSDMLIEKYELDEHDAQKIKKALLGADYVMQTTWVLSGGLKRRFQKDYEVYA